MLEYLHISNLALIEDMTLEFASGINVLTGETGAGKSFILKALNFVLGEKLNADIVRPGAEKARVEAIFVHNGEELILRRELSAESGRSRFYINDVLSSQDALKDLREKLISYASQHAQQQLLQPIYQAALLETYFPQRDLLTRRDELLAQLKKIAETIANLKSKQATLAEKRELLEMQKDEIDKVNPEPGEEEELEEKRREIKNREDERKIYDEAMAILHGDGSPGLLQSLADLGRVINYMAIDDPEIRNLQETIDGFRDEITHFSNTFRRPRAASSKADLDAIEERLFEFAQLKRKLKRSLPQILDLKSEIEENLSFLDACALDIAFNDKEEKKYTKELRSLVAEIIPLRHESAAKFASELEGQLRDLGFSEHVKVTPDFVETEIWPGVKDEKGRVFWAPNPGQKPQPLDKIASGGELSRFLLGLNILGEQDREITFIFDEVDAGVGGLTLNKVLEKLQALARRQQIILITHWPQLAAKANKHFQIAKTVKEGNTYTQCKALDSEGRFREIERMSGGGKEGAAMAKNLLGQ